MSSSELGVDIRGSGIAIKALGLTQYEPVWQAMQAFTKTRHNHTQDEIWWTQHYPVYTQGRAGKAEHILTAPKTIPIVQTDRGGQVTYHGPGQLVVYPLLQLKRYGIGVRELVTLIESSIVELLAGYGLTAQARKNAPGVYIDHAKIASLGLRISRGCSFHGLALNVENDLTPFEALNPCGYAGLQMTSMANELGQGGPELEATALKLIAVISDKLSQRL